MNRTHLEHTMIALAAQLLLMPFIGAWHAGALAVAVFFGREIAQHEVKALQLQQYSSLNLGTLPWWIGLVYGWNRDSVLDVAMPALLCAALAMAVTALGIA